MPPLPPSVEVRMQVITLEERLERIRIRRTALPAGFVPFVVLAFVFLGEEILGTPWGTTTFSWFITFISAAVAGLVINEIAARRAIYKLKETIMQLSSMK